MFAVSSRADDMQISDKPSSRVGDIPSDVGDFPSDVGDFPSSVGDFPTSVGDFPSSVGDFPSSVGAFPSNVGALPSNVGALPTNVGALPTSVRDFPTDNFIKKYCFGEWKYGYFCLHLCCLGHIRGDFFFSVACCHQPYHHNEDGND